MILQVSKARSLLGTVRAPSDKSLTHRAYIFAMLASRGVSLIRNPLQGEDCENTLRIIGQLGAEVKRGQNQIAVSPPATLQQPTQPLDCGNSGTTMRLLAGVLASSPGIGATLVGDESLSRRPMKRVTDPLRMMGADITGDSAPITVHGSNLNGIEYETPVASAQIKGCLLLAGLRAQGTTWITEPAKSRDHTERMLKALGVELQTKDANSVGVTGGQTWEGFEFSVPSDISSAAFFMCAAAMVPGSRVLLQEVGTNPTRTGVLEALAQAGAHITLVPRDDQMGEPVSDIEVIFNKLLPFEIKGDIVPRLIDEIPVLAVLATQCEGTTSIRDAKELRVKESDRIETVANNLRSMGANVETHDDGMDVTGPTPLKGATINAQGDHRIGMAFAVAGLVASGQTTIENADSIATSYPGFESDLDTLADRT